MPASKTSSMKYSNRARRFSATVFCLSKVGGLGRAIREQHVGPAGGLGKCAAVKVREPLARRAARCVIWPGDCRGNRSMNPGRALRFAAAVAAVALARPAIAQGEPAAVAGYGAVPGVGVVPRSTAVRG